MDDKVKAFLEDLKLKLSGLPDIEKKEALDYYEEYLNDALDDGKNAEELLSHLNPPEKIAAMIKAEASIRKARKNPGLKNYLRVLKYAFSNITKPFSALLFSIFIFVTYSTAIILFCGAFISAAAVLVLLPGSIFEAAKIPGKYAAEITGTVGIGLFAAMLCLLAAYGLFKLFRLFIRISSSLVGRMLKKSRRTIPEVDEAPAEKGRSYRLFVKICIGIAAASLILTFATGLPVKLFMIFNSMKPFNVTTQTWEYDKSAVNIIRIASAHSHIKLEKGDSDKIKIAYEQPDWVEPIINNTDGILTFIEESNGRLPLFSLVSMHENRTDVTVSLPEGFEPAELKLESRGGFVNIDGTDFNVQVKTYTGNIYLESNGSTNPFGLEASTSTGIILEGGKAAGTKSSNGLEYKVVAQNGSSIELETFRGNIFID